MVKDLIMLKNLVFKQFLNYHRDSYYLLIYVFIN